MAIEASGINGKKIYANHALKDSNNQVITATYEKKLKFGYATDEHGESKIISINNSALSAGAIYSAGPNINVDIETKVISGRDWTPELNTKQDNLTFGYGIDEEGVSKIISINNSALSAGEKYTGGDYIQIENKEISVSGRKLLEFDFNTIYKNEDDTKIEVGLIDAPKDGKQYTRTNGSWVPVNQPYYGPGLKLNNGVLSVTGKQSKFSDEQVLDILDISNIRNNLSQNYYTKPEMDSIISQLGGIELVSLNEQGKPNVDNPNPKILYLTFKSTGIYTQWIYTTNWIKLGPDIDLSNYIQFNQISAGNSIKITPNYGITPQFYNNKTKELISGPYTDTWPTAVYAGYSGAPIYSDLKITTDVSLSKYTSLDLTISYNGTLALQTNILDYNVGDIITTNLSMFTLTVTEKTDKSIYLAANGSCLGPYLQYTITSEPTITSNLKIEVDNNNCTNNGFNNLVAGNYNNINGSYNLGVGSYNTANNSYGALIGIGNYSKYDYETVVGKYNISNPSYASNPLFVVGNGTGNTTRSDAFVVLQNGTVSAKKYIIPEQGDLYSYLTGTYYTKTEVDTAISNFGGFEVHASLDEITNPKTNIIYLIGPKGTLTDKYEEYIYTANDGYVLIGETTVDLSNYYQKTETSSTTELNTAFGNKQDNLTTEQLSAISSVSGIENTVNNMGITVEYSNEIVTLSFGA